MTQERRGRKPAERAYKPRLEVKLDVTGVYPCGKAIRADSVADGEFINLAYEGESVALGERFIYMTSPEYRVMEKSRRRHESVAKRKKEIDAQIEKLKQESAQI